jgi:hypothetical protein
MSRAPQAIADFDSASAMLRALACLRGEGFPALGLSQALRPLATATNLLPKGARKLVYAWSGWAEAMPASALRDVRCEVVSRWMVENYPKRRYPAVMIGSSNGAITYLCALLGIPWLPRTWLIPVRQSGLDPDDAVQSLQYGIDLASMLLDANPELQLHHMHDANQDRLMIQHMTYFRVRKLRLGEAYLNSAAPYDHIGIMLFSHGMDSIGVAPIDRWREQLARAHTAGTFLGVDEDADPADFATFARYHEAIRRLPPRPAPPKPMTLADLSRFLAEQGHRYPVRWLQGSDAA